MLRKNLFLINAFQNNLDGLKRETILVNYESLCLSIGVDVDDDGVDDDDLGVDDDDDLGAEDDN